MPTIKRPKFSVLMANYNNGKYLAEAIESVLRQTYQNWELLIMDDCSTDNSREIIEKFSKLDERIGSFYNRHNLGYIEVLGVLTQAAKGEIMAIIDSDDALVSPALEKVVEVYDANPSVGFVYTNFKFCDNDLRPIKDGFSRQIPHGGSEIFDYYVGHLKTFKSSDYRKTSGFDNDILYAEDRDLILKMEEVTEFYFLDEILYWYRKTPTSQTTGQIKSQISRISHAIAKYKAYLRRQQTDFPNLTAKAMSAVLFDVIPACLKINDRRRFKLVLFNAIKLSPFSLANYFKLLYRIIKFPLRAR